MGIKKYKSDLITWMCNLCARYDECWLWSQDILSPDPSAGEAASANNRAWSGPAHPHRCNAKQATILPYKTTLTSRVAIQIFDSAAQFKFFFFDSKPKQSN